MKKANLAEGIILLVIQVVFCTAFISACEVPNWQDGKRSPTACLDRWMFTSGVFLPSGVQAVAAQSAVGTKRRPRRKIVTT